MSSLPLNAGASPFLPVGFEDKRAAVLKHIARSERLVAVRPASRLEVRPRPEMISTGVSELDAITGGIPRGCLTEIYGPASSGKTSVLLATVAAATRREEACVLIDASDSFDPASAATAGLDCNKLLWVRCGDHKLPRKARAEMSVSSNSIFMEARASSPVLKLEQVLQATDLILQSGGFGLVALDLAGIPHKFVRRIPLASWFRFQRAVEHTKTALLVISEFPYAQTCAALVMKLSAVTQGCPTLVSPLFGETGWGCSHPAETPTHVQVLEGMPVEAEVVRWRLERKPMQSLSTKFATRAVRVG